MSTGKKIAASIIISLLLASAAQPAGEPGFKEVYTIQLTDLNGQDAWLPYIGEFPVVIIYEDFRNLDENRELYLKTLKHPEFFNKLKLIYISNTAPAWLTPDRLIFQYFRERKKDKDYMNIRLLIDRERLLQKKWRLPDSDGKSVIILVSSDAEIIDLIYDTPDKSGIEKIFGKLKAILDF